MKKKIRFFLALLSLFYCVSAIQSTYAKYTSSASANTNITVARWNVLVNTQDIKNNSDFSTVLTPTFNGTTNISANVIAPTAEGYFDIVLNADNTDVSFNSTVTIAVDVNSDVKDLQFTKYTINGGTTEYTFTGTDYSVQKSFLAADTSKTVTYRFYVKWLDGTGETMDNAADTVTTASGKAIIDVNVNVTQTAN
jgi:hypothetical protein